jgi:hypothetical protein
MLGLVAPVTMSADQQTLWLASAVETLSDATAEEVLAVSVAVRQTVTRPSQIVPEVTRLVVELRNERAEQRRREHMRSIPIGPPPKKHVLDRRGEPMSDDDTAELNRLLELQGANARYRPDGSRYVISA